MLEPAAAAFRVTPEQAAAERRQRAAFLQCDYEAHAAVVGERGLLIPAADYAVLRDQCMRAKEAADPDGNRPE